MKRINRSLRNKLNKSGPRIESGATLEIISSQLLKTTVYSNLL